MVVQDLDDGESHDKVPSMRPLCDLYPGANKSWGGEGEAGCGVVFFSFFKTAMCNGWWQSGLGLDSD